MTSLEAYHRVSTCLCGRMTKSTMVWESVKHKMPDKSSMYTFIILFAQDYLSTLACYSLYRQLVAIDIFSSYQYKEQKPII